MKHLILHQLNTLKNLS